MVLSVTAASIKLSSIFKVSFLMSTKTGTAPLSIIALAVDTKVYEGKITSSPSFRSINSIAISRAWVPEVVNNAFFVSNFDSIKSLHHFVNFPSPDTLLAAYASFIYSSSLPNKFCLLKGIML